MDIDLSYNLVERVQTQTATEYNRKGKPLAEPVMSMFSYEASGEQQSQSGPQAPEPMLETFNYDDLGNRQDYVRDIGLGYTHSETYTTNDFNQYTQITTDPLVGSIVSESLQYDLAGNLIVDKQGYQYFYDEENRLIGVDDINNNPVVDYEYDAFGRRIRMEDAATNVTSYYYYDMDWRVTSEYEHATSLSATEPPKLARSFIYGNGIDEVLGMFCPGSPESGSTSDLTTLGQFAATWLKTSTDSGYNGTFDTNTDNKITLPDFTSLRTGWTYQSAGPEQRWYYLKDGLGSVMGVVGSHSRAESEFYLYDVYGKSNDQTHIGNPYRFTGRRLDILDQGQFELQYNRNRYYHNDLGRWLNPDPAGYVDGLNKYQYVMSNPTGHVDPDGKVAKPVLNALSKLVGASFTVSGMASEFNPYSLSITKISDDTPIAAPTISVAPYWHNLDIYFQWNLRDKGNILKFCEADLEGKPCNPKKYFLVDSIRTVCKNWRYKIEYLHRNKLGKLHQGFTNNLGDVRTEILNMYTDLHWKSFDCDCRSKTWKIDTEDINKNYNILERRARQMYLDYINWNGGDYTPYYINQYLMPLGYNQFSYQTDYLAKILERLGVFRIQ